MLAAVSVSDSVSPADFVYLCVCIKMYVCLCVGQCAILRSTKNESDNKDNIFVIEKFTAGYICASCRFVVVGFGFGFGFRTATPKSMLCHRAQHSQKKKSMKKKINLPFHFPPAFAHKWQSIFVLWNFLQVLVPC